MKIIECQGLSKNYGKAHALKELSFEIDENTITGLIGRNGAGKTTLLKILSGYYQKSSGVLNVFSEDPFNSINVSSNMIFIDDHMTFPQSLSLLEILKSAESFYSNWDMKLAKNLFDYFGFHSKHYHQGLSKGMKSTFNSIIGISARCSLTILDEPTTGMDKAVRKDFYRALLKDYIQFPRTIILSSHLLNEIEDILEDILLIRQGEKRLHMSVADLREYAIGVRGKAEVVEEVTKNMEILHEERVGRDSTYFVVKNIFTDATKQQARKIGIEFTPVTTDDLCVYLTATHKGGIDHVFNKN